MISHDNSILITRNLIGYRHFLHVIRKDFNMRQATCLKDEVLKFQKYDDPYKLLSFILNEFCSRFVMAVSFILPTPLFRREFRRKRFFY